MTITPRKRGRPPGSGQDLSPYLIKVADRIARGPKISPTSAMREVIKGAGIGADKDRSMVRRMQAKWRTEGPALLRDAHDRALARNFMATAATIGQGIYFAHEKLAALINSEPVLKLATQLDHGLLSFERWMRSLDAARALDPMLRFDNALKALANDPVHAKWMALSKPLGIRNLDDKLRP